MRAALGLGALAPATSFKAPNQRPAARALDSGFAYRQKQPSNCPLTHRASPHPPFTSQARKQACMSVLGESTIPLWGVSQGCGLRCRPDEPLPRLVAPERKRYSGNAVLLPKTPVWVDISGTPFLRGASTWFWEEPHGATCAQLPVRYAWPDRRVEGVTRTQAHARSYRASLTLSSRRHDQR